MPILAFDPVPAELEAARKRRQELGLDHWDEVWEGVLHMIPPPSVEHQEVGALLAELLGPSARGAGLRFTLEVAIGQDEHNYRAPDLAALRLPSAIQWNQTAALVVEILSPRDTAWDTLAFYADHNVDELLYVDLEKREIIWMALQDGEYRHVERSGLIDLGLAAVRAQLNWS
jgi:Uma2 family endonuclease